MMSLIGWKARYTSLLRIPRDIVQKPTIIGPWTQTHYIRDLCILTLAPANFPSHLTASLISYQGGTFRENGCVCNLIKTPVDWPTSKNIIRTKLKPGRAALSAVSKQQQDAATGDAMGIFLVGVPVSSTFGGDKEGQVAVSKGKVNAIEANLNSKGCNIPAATKSSGSKVQKWATWHYKQHVLDVSSANSVQLRP